MDPTWAIALTWLGLVLAVAGLIGCVLPVIPGVPVSYLSLIVLSLAKDWEPFSTPFLAVMGGLTILTLVLDYAVPAIGAKKVGATKWGIWGSVLGMIIGLIFFPPFGLFIGGFLGAMAGELYAGRSGDQALKAGLVVFVGNLLAIALKMGLCGVILFFYIKGMF
jgi:uncharacterized protein YqgC (DUF456 family)